MTNNQPTQVVTRRGGVGLVPLVTIVFVILKLTGTISWSWWWVLSPLWISVGLSVALFVGLLLIAVLAAAFAGSSKNTTISGPIRKHPRGRTNYRNGR